MLIASNQSLHVDVVIKKMKESHQRLIEKDALFKRKIIISSVYPLLNRTFRYNLYCLTDFILLSL